MNEWFEVFRTGNHTDTSGRERLWDVHDLERIAASYNPLEHEAPIVIGHPKDDSPAYGWIESLKVEGDKLLAKPKQLVAEFMDWVNRGLYKKISIALYPDLSLKHVGFLGAVPPAVKGLAQAGFSKTNALQYEFFLEGGLQMKQNLDPGKEIDRRVREFLKNPPKFDKYWNEFPAKISYRDALNYVLDEDPELAEAYLKTIRPERERELSEKELKSVAAGKKIVTLVTEKIRLNKNLSYSEALTEVQRENKNLILEYLGR